MTAFPHKVARVKPGAFVALEGLDATGKSTQIDLMKTLTPKLFMNPVPYISHQPSGESEVGRHVYAITERCAIDSPWARQFLHLASHAEHYSQWILPMLEERAVILDRCWWSTVAYGWGGGNIKESMELYEFLKIAQLPAQGRIPDLVLLFMEPHMDDRHNTPEVAEAYEQLAELYEGIVVRVPKLDKIDTNLFIFQAMEDHDLLDPWEETRAADL